MLCPTRYYAIIAICLSPFVVIAWLSVLSRHVPGGLKASSSAAILTAMPLDYSRLLALNFRTNRLS